MPPLPQQRDSKSEQRLNGTPVSGGGMDLTSLQESKGSKDPGVGGLGLGEG